MNVLKPNNFSIISTCWTGKIDFIKIFRVVQFPYSVVYVLWSNVDSPVTSVHISSGHSLFLSSPLDKHTPLFLWCAPRDKKKQVTKHSQWWKIPSNGIDLYGKIRDWQESEREKTLWNGNLKVTKTAITISSYSTDKKNNALNERTNKQTNQIRKTIEK